MPKTQPKPAPLPAQGPLPDSSGTALIVPPRKKDIFTVEGEKHVIRDITQDFSVKTRLTHAVVSIARRGTMAVQIRSEMYEREMPIIGKASQSNLTTLIDCFDLESGEEVTLICNALIKSALIRAMGEVKQRSTADQLDGVYPTPQYTHPLIGRYFAMRSGTIRDDKRYRDVDVVELQPTK